MSFVRAANLTRMYGSGTLAATSTVVGLKHDPVVQAAGAAGFGLSTSGPWGYSIPIQWEVKNNSTTATLQFTFSPLGFVPTHVDVVTGVTILDNWIDLLPGQAYSMQKRHYAQEFGEVGSFDLYRMYGRGDGVTCPFSVTVDIWIPAGGA